MISLLVPYRADSGSERAVAWQWVKTFWQRELPNAEIVMGTDYEKPFSKTTAVNDAYRRAHGDVFVVTDADAVLEPEVVLYATYLAKQRGTLVVPWDSSTRLTQGATTRLMSGEITLDDAKVTPTEEKRPSPLSAGIMFAITRSAFETVNGMDSRFRGWGHEDVSFRVACDTLLGSTQYVSGGWITCLFHPRPKINGGFPTWGEGDDGGRTTRKLAQVYLNAANRKDMMREVVNQHPLNGEAEPIPNSVPIDFFETVRVPVIA